jgi:hypothetical protein
MSVLQGCCKVLHKYGADWVQRGPTGVEPPGHTGATKSLQIGGLAGSKTEGEGFEPSVDRKAHNGFRDRPVQPLRHPSGLSDSRRGNALSGE